jgi:putative phosphoesterase
MGEKKRTDILILSDTHGNISSLEYVMKKIAPGFDLAVFLGDGVDDFFQNGRCICPIPFYCVRGNCDTRLSLFGNTVEGYGAVEETLTLNIRSHKIFMCHGHTLGVKGGLVRLAMAAAEKGADIALFGHTHECLEKRCGEGLFLADGKDLTLFNPGSLKGSYFSPSTFGTLSVSDEGVLFGHGRV